MWVGNNFHLQECAKAQLDTVLDSSALLPSLFRQFIKTGSCVIGDL